MQFFVPFVLFAILFAVLAKPAEARSSARDSALQNDLDQLRKRVQTLERVITDNDRDLGNRIDRL